MLYLCDDEGKLHKKDTLIVIRAEPTVVVLRGFELESLQLSAIAKASRSEFNDWYSTERVEEDTAVIWRNHV